MNIFSINEKGPTNKTLDIIVTLPDDIINYTYKIYENDNLINSYDIIGNTNNIKLEETGKYQIIVEAIDINNNITNYKSGYYIIDKIPPIITANLLILFILPNDFWLFNISISSL